jgi:hypothetical protein
MKIISNSKPIKRVTMSKRFMPNKGLNKLTSPILLLVRVRLASQRGGRLAKLTNENA